jgi:CPA1 family monovalent cation:H+ antiporter
VPPDQGALLALAVALVALGVSAWARRHDVPYPVALVALGLALGAVPHLPEFHLDPDVVLLGFLPPIVYVAAYRSSPRELLEHGTPIVVLATGLVVATAAAVACVAHFAIGMDWRTAVVLGTVLGPTDPVAATAVMSRLRVRSGLRTLVEGEGLVNDAVALVVYAIAIDLAVGEHPSAGSVTLSFVQAVAVGVAVGSAVGWLATSRPARLQDAPVEVAFSLLVPYAAYLPAYALDGSGVLAAMAAGLWVAWRGHVGSDAESRLDEGSFWAVTELLLNGAVFVLIGLEFRALRDDLATGLGAIIGWSFLAAGLVLVVRLAWVFTVPHGLRRVPRLPFLPDLPARRERLLIAFSGMRGAVSLAAALAVPVVTRVGDPLPDRSTLIGITFGVVVVTLLVQGSSINRLVVALGLRSESSSTSMAARAEAAQLALDHLDAAAGRDEIGAEATATLRELYQARVQRLCTRLDEAATDEHALLAEEQRLQRELLDVERRALVEMRDTGRVTTADLAEAMRALDLEAAQLTQIGPPRAPDRDHDGRGPG